MRVWNFIVLMNHRVIISKDPPVPHRVMLVQHTLEPCDILTTGRITKRQVYFHGYDAQSGYEAWPYPPPEVTAEELLAIQKSVRKELLPLVQVVKEEK